MRRPETSASAIWSSRCVEEQNSTWHAHKAVAWMLNDAQQKSIQEAWTRLWTSGLRGRRLKRAPSRPNASLSLELEGRDTGFWLAIPSPWGRPKLGPCGHCASL